MKPFPALAFLLLTGVLFAGCSGGTTETSTSTQPVLAADKGAVSGLLIDDVYRPIPGGLVLLQGAGLTATTDDEGQFQFLDVAPGSYVAIASAEGHEAAPVNVDVVVAQYSDLEIQARRIFSNDGYIVTTPAPRPQSWSPRCTAVLRTPTPTALACRCRTSRSPTSPISWPK